MTRRFPEIEQDMHLSHAYFIDIYGTIMIANYCKKWVKIGLMEKKEAIYVLYIFT